MFVLKFFGLVAAMAVVVNAAPVDDPHPLHQLTPEEEAAQEAAFAAMSLEQRLVFTPNTRSTNQRGQSSVL